MVAKFAEAPLESETEAQHMDGKSVDSIALQESFHWKVYVDGAANQRGSGMGLVLVSHEMLAIEK